MPPISPRACLGAVVRIVAFDGCRMLAVPERRAKAEHCPAATRGETVRKEAGGSHGSKRAPSSGVLIARWHAQG